LLQALAQRYPTKLTRTQLGTLARFTPSGGTFGTYFQTLKRHGLLTVSAQGDVEITPAGLAYLGSDVSPPRATAFPLRFLALVWITPADGSTRVSANLRCLRASLSWHTWVAARPSAASRARCGRSARA
jgi:hypothetical protein